MAYNFTDQANGNGVPFNYTRGNPIPLDSWSLFMSTSDAETYAKTNPVSYPGQVITVLEDGSSTVYVINPGTSYTQEEKDSDDANEENPVEGYVNKIPEGKTVGDEKQETRSIVKLSASNTSGAEMYWLGEDGNQI